MTRASILTGLGCVLGVLLLAGDPGVLSGRVLLGVGTADIWGHIWGYGWVADALAQGRVPFEGAPVSFPFPQVWWVIDLPAATLLLPLTLLDPGLAWNAALLLPVLLGGAGAQAWLARRGLEVWTAALGAAVFALSPFARGAIASGVPEGLVVLFVPVFLLLLEPGLRGSRLHLVGAVLLAPLLALDGAYGGVIGGLVGAFALFEALRQTRDARVLLRGLPVAGLAAAALVLTRAALQASEHPALVSSSSRGELREAGAWTLQSLGGADLASFFVPSLLLPELSAPTGHRHLVYVGLVALVGAGLAAWREPRARGPLGFAMLVVLLALGPELRVWGRLTGLPLPGRALWELGATNAYRLAGLVPLFLALALGLGLRPRWLLGAVLLDTALLAPGGLPLPTVPSPQDEVLQALAELPEGGVLDLPFDHEGEDNRGLSPQRTFGLQAWHGHPVASGLYRTPPAVRLHKRLAQFDSAVHQSLADPEATSGVKTREASRWRRIGEAPEGQQAELLEALLWREGFRFLLLDLARIPPAQHADARAWARGWLGEPYAASEALELWLLPERKELPDMPPRPREGQP